MDINEAELDQCFPTTAEEIRAMVAKIDGDPVELPERLRNADAVFDRMIDTLSAKWWGELSPDAQAQWMADLGEGATIVDAYRDWIAEHEACAICGTIKHYAEMLRPSDGRWNGDLVCSQRCADVWCDGPDL